uniref:Uncharacterized protein n=1 Tax=Sphingobacterium sp. (strain 21) TaxID=743722 RepID=F4C3V6_SPHS2
MGLIVHEFYLGLQQIFEICLPTLAFFVRAIISWVIKLL